MMRVAGRAYRAMVRLLDETSLLALLVIFAALIMTFGVFYTVMTPSENGVMHSTELKDFNFYNGLYFSIVTVSSLGYGDMYPVGWSKIAATAEVILGLGFIGIMLAKLTSRPLTHLVSRIFVSSTRDRLKEFEVVYNKSLNNFRSLLGAIADTYQATPGDAQPRPENSPPKEMFVKTIEGLKAACSDLHDYVSAETRESIFFRLVPTTSTTSLAEAIERAFFALGQCIISLPTSSNPEILDEMLNPRNRRTIAESIEYQKSICIEFSQSKYYDHEIVDSFKRVNDVCDQVSGSYFLTPELEQPDQTLTYETPAPA